MKYFLFSSALILLVFLYRSIRSNSSLKIRNDLLSTQLEGARKQIELLESIVFNLNKIFTLLGQKYEARPSVDQLTQLELLSKIAEDSLQRELRIKTDVVHILERYYADPVIKTAVAQLFDVTG